MIGPTDFFRWFGLPGVVAISCLLAFLVALGWYALRARTFRMTLAVFALACAAWIAGWWNAHALADVEIDDSARLEAEAEARRQRLAAAVETRREQAPGIRFAEDADVDVLDLAGTAELGTTEEESLLEEATPAYRRRGPQIRRLTSDAEDSPVRGVNIDADAAAELDAVRRMKTIRRLPPDELYRAGDLSAANRLLTRGLVWIALALLVVHYLRHYYATGNRVPPIPLPPLLLDMTTSPPIWVRQIDRDMLDRELDAILRRGEAFLCCGTMQESENRFRLPFGLCNMPVTDCGTPEHADLSPAFVLESAWYGRGAFFLPSNSLVKSLVGTMLPFLHTRYQTHARPRRILWLVWALDTPIPENWLALLSMYTEALHLGILHVDAPGAVRRIPSKPGTDNTSARKTTAQTSSRKRTSRSASKKRASPPASQASTSKTPVSPPASQESGTKPPTSISTPQASTLKDRASTSSTSALKKKPPFRTRQTSAQSPDAPFKPTVPPAETGSPTPSAPSPPTPEAPPKDRVFATCPHCGRRMKLLGSMRGKRIRCPDCKNPMRVPDR